MANDPSVLGRQPGSEALRHDLVLIATAPPALVSAVAAEVILLLPLAGSIGSGQQERRGSWRENMPPALAELVTWFEQAIGPENLRAGDLKKIAPGVHLPSHVDYRVEDRLPPTIGSHRATLSIQSDPGVEFQCGGRTVAMKPGELWLWNGGVEHSATNSSARDRLYLLYDVHPRGHWWPSQEPRLSLVEGVAVERWQ